MTALAWPAGRGGELAFATADGKVRVGVLKTNKATTLYAHLEQSYVVSLCASPDGNGVCSGHLDGSVFVFSFVTGIATRLATHACAPYGLAWGKAPAPADALSINPKPDREGVIACAGADKKLTFYDARGEGVGRSRPSTTARTIPSRRASFRARRSRRTARLWRLVLSTPSTSTAWTRGGVFGF